MLVDPADIVISHSDVLSVTCCVLGLNFMQYEVTWSRISKRSNLKEGTCMLLENVIIGTVYVL